jgi:hypothetical protein
MSASPLYPQATCYTNRYATTSSGFELYANFHYPPLSREGKTASGIFIAYHGGGIIMGSREEDILPEPVRSKLS